MSADGGPARPATRARVHAAALALASEVGLAALTMEGIAARAGAGKQTLYRTWSSPADIAFDALLARSEDLAGEVRLPDTGDLPLDLATFLEATVAELHDPATEPLLRAATAEVQSRPDLALRMRSHLIDPQVEAVAGRLRRGGRAEADEVAELLLGPVLHRWLLRGPRPDPGWVRRHVARVLRGSAAG